MDAPLQSNYDDDPNATGGIAEAEYWMQKGFRTYGAKAAESTEKAIRSLAKGQDYSLKILRAKMVGLLVFSQNTSNRVGQKQVDYALNLSGQYRDSVLGFSTNATRLLQRLNQEVYIAEQRARQKIRSNPTMRYLLDYFTSYRTVGPPGFNCTWGMRGDFYCARYNSRGMLETYGSGPVAVRKINKAKG